MRSATLTIGRSCLRENSSSSGMRAISPSSRMISQMTPAGSRPARRARSTEPSVCPSEPGRRRAARAAGNTCPGIDQIVGAGAARDGDADRLGPLARRDAGGRPVAGVDADRERRVVARLVVGRHHRQPELGHALLGERQADEAPPLAGHEVDRLGGDQIGRHRQIALVLAILVVDQDDHAAGADRLDGALDGGVALARALGLSGQRRTSSRSRSTAGGPASGRRPRRARRRVRPAARRAWRSGRSRC